MEWFAESTEWTVRQVTGVEVGRGDGGRPVNRLPHRPKPTCTADYVARRPASGSHSAIPLPLAALLPPPTSLSSSPPPSTPSSVTPFTPMPHSASWPVVKD